MTTKDRVVELMRPDIISCDDGYKVWWPVNMGAFSAHTLRLMADILDEENKEWDKQLNEYFGNVTPNVD